MKDYSLILEATNTAKTLLNDYIPLANQDLRQKGADALHQIAEYLQTRLKNAGFPNISVYEDHRLGYHGETIRGNIVLRCRNEPCFHYNGERFNVFLDVSTHEGVLDIFINDTLFVIKGGYPDYTVLCLCEYWKKLKANIDSSIDRYFRCKNQEIEERIHKIERDREILDNFEI